MAVGVIKWTDDFEVKQNIIVSLSCGVKSKKNMYKIRN